MSGRPRNSSRLGRWTPARPALLARAAAGLLCLLALSGCALAEAWGESNRPVRTVRVKVVDESGRPVPHAVVWSFEGPCLPELTRVVDCLEPAQLLRLAERLRDSVEYSAPYTAPKPYRGIGSGVGVDGAGEYRSTDALAHADPTGAGRPWTALVFIKQGYLPALARFEADPSTRRYEASVVLRRDPGRAPGDDPARARYEAICFELSDPVRNAAMDAANQARLDGLRRSLEQLADAALARGDRVLAARAFYRLAYLPSVSAGPGPSSGPATVGGYSAGGRGPEADALRRRARELDPDNAFHFRDDVNESVLFTADEQGRPRWPADAAARAALRAPALAHAATVRERWDSLWPTSFFRAAAGLTLAGAYEEAFAWLREFDRREPPHFGARLAYDRLREAMKSSGTPVPPDWALEARGYQRR